MNEKISLTTIHSQNNNFGSVWQAFALSWFLEKNGYRPETLDYRPSYSNGLTSVKRIPTMLAGRLLHGSAVRTREKRFQSFISSRPLSRRYARYNEIKSCPPQADVYLIGSDQVWNPDYLCGNDPAYYLEFTDSNKKLAFSASAGKLLSQDEAGDLLRKTKCFCSMSLREDLTAKQLNDAGREDAVHTLDPVFLLDGDEYRSLVIRDRRSQERLYPGLCDQQRRSSRRGCSQGARCDRKARYPNRWPCLEMCKRLFSARCRTQGVY